MTDLLEGVAFSVLPTVGCKAFREGVERHGAAAAAFRAWTNAAEREKALAAADDLVTRAVAANATILLNGEQGYPEALLDLPQPPGILYALGDLRCIAGRHVGIVGTRHSSAAGERIAHQLAGVLARAGAIVVSGMALGIDAAAHRGAMDAGGGTIAVLGGGVDLPYPPTHATLHNRIANEGLVVSEAPPGSRPTKGAFPRRNRIIAALSELLIVVEAGDRSGALITAGIALELGRSVAAVPGPIDSPRHVGSNRLLFEGASFIARVDDVASLAGLETVTAKPRSVEPGRESGSEADDTSHSAVLDAVRAGASDLEDLARSTRLSPRDFASALTTLELRGRLRVTDTGSVALIDRA